MNQRFKPAPVTGHEPEQVIGEVITTTENVIDIVTCLNMINGYKAIAQLSAMKGTDEEGKKFSRGEIVQVQTVPVQTPARIVGGLPVVQISIVCVSKKLMPGMEVG